MGRLRDELTDPWGLLVAGVVGGMAGVLPGTGLLIGTAVGATVYGVKVATGTLLRGGGRPAPALARPDRGSPAAVWLSRAEVAVRQLQELTAAGSTRPTQMRSSELSPTDLSTRAAAEQAQDVLVAIRRLGAQAATLSQALRGADMPGLDLELQRLRAAAASRPDDESAQRSAAAVADRVGVRDRLRAAAAALDGRLQSSALGLEGVLARVAEVRATADAVGQIDPTPADLAALTGELEGLRGGLADVELVARRALGQSGP